MRRRRGWVFIDAVWGMILISALAGIFVTAANREQAGLQKLADTRAACRLAEETILDLQQGKGLPNLEADEKVEIVKLNPQGTWIHVDATVRGRPAELAGYVAGGVKP
jgi:hypothetical protein